MDDISHDSGCWGVTLLVEDDAGVQLKVAMSDEVYRHRHAINFTNEARLFCVNSLTSIIWCIELSCATVQ